MAVCNLTVGNVELSKREEDGEEEEELTISWFSSDKVRLCYTDVPENE